eukprot:TRINITY_DN7350_c0_g1_i1.p1 TRINITY_DN7350_c0_g1~~TRINITY_DN7350_c0_g1_i1.p1  ORF type:complete len:103 (-),score=31.23 TRINITY_DN7350_c0_g1_i1:144-422(-)
MFCRFFKLNNSFSKLNQNKTRFFSMNSSNSKSFIDINSIKFKKSDSYKLQLSNSSKQTNFKRGESLISDFKIDNTAALTTLILFFMSGDDGV